MANIRSIEQEETSSAIKSNTIAEVEGGTPTAPVTAEVAVKVTALIHPDEDGGFWVEVPALPGCVTEEETIEETVRLPKEAASAWLASKHRIEMRHS